jgi:hypothetical protein
MLNIKTQHISEKFISLNNRLFYLGDEFVVNSLSHLFRKVGFFIK